jgi:hypothetical protein
MNLNFFLKWAATIITIAGALAVSLKLDPLNIYLLNVGSILWVIWGWRIREPSIITVNIVILAIYMYGLIVRV